MAGLTPQLPLVKSTLNDYTLITNYVNLVRQNLKILLYTAPGERIMDLNFGVGLHHYLFEIDNAGLYTQIKGRIKNQVRQYLPYITITNLLVESAQVNPTMNNNTLNVQVTYRIVPLEMIDRLELSLPTD